MRVALLGDFDTYLFRGRERPPELGQYRLSPALNLARGFRELGVADVHYFVDTPEVDRPTVDEGPFGVLHRLPCPRFSGTASFQLWRRRNLLRALRQLRPALVHGQGTEAEYAFTAVTAPYPHVVTFHGIMHRILQAHPPPLWSPLQITRWLEKVVVRRARHVICLSAEVENFLREHHSPARCHRIPNAVAPCFFAVPPPRAAAGFTLAFVGTIYRLKGVRELIEAVAAVQRRLGQPVRVELAGPASDAAYAAALRRRIQELNLEQQVAWRGALSEQGVADLLARADALVLPSWQETAPMCISEAMAAGRAVVATRVGGVPDQVADGQTGLLVSPGNSAELATALHTVLTDAELRSQMGAAGRARALANFTPRIVAERTLAVYRVVT
jgi:glycosyltransferase involved in cell wall biosynthesis